MFRKLSILLVAVMIMISCMPVMAAEEPVVFKSTITVTEDGGRYQVGFVNLEFKKDFLVEDKLPVTFDVIVSAKNGVAGIEIKPDTPNFFKGVHIRVDAYQGLLYDETSGENIQVNIEKQHLKVGHFSRYAFS